MIDLSPIKILVVLVVALVVLGPDKLPTVARQLGALWHDLRLWRSRLEREVRGAFPDLPSPQRITEAVRSPISFLDRLADEHGRDLAEDASALRAARALPSAGAAPGDDTGAEPAAGDVGHATGVGGGSSDGADDGVVVPGGAQAPWAVPPPDGGWRFGSAPPDVGSGGVAAGYDPSMN